MQMTEPKKKKDRKLNAATVIQLATTKDSIYNNKKS